MKTTWQKYKLKPALLACALGFAVPAMAQYVWLNENGTKQYSDMPPPSSVPDKRIIKAPGNSLPKNSAKAPEGGTAPDAAASTKPGAVMTTAERNADFQKRKLEQAEKDKKESEDSKSKADKSKNCERARNYQRVLESGQRISQTDKDGERTFMGDDERDHESQEAKRIVDQCS